MKKIVLLASMVALAALMLAAAPASAQAVCEKDNPGEEHNPHCDEDFVFVFDNDDDDDDNDNDNDRDVFRNLDFGNVEVSPVIDISQETEQDCDSGEISQPVSVDSGGDNSVTTVGLQPTANTGCVQNATGVLQAAPIVAGLGGDTIFAPEDNNGNNDDDDRDLVFCDFDDDGNDDGDDCEGFADDNDGPGNACEHRGGGEPPFCDDEDFIFVNDDDDDNDNDNDRDVFRNIGNDELNITGPDFGDVEVDSDASLDVSPSQVIHGGGQVNQAASAASTTWVLTPWGWKLM